MSQPSTVFKLPPELRKQVERRLVEQGFHNYQAVADWVREQGYDISLAALGRYGVRFRRQLEGTQLAVLQARAIVEAAPDYDGAVPEALLQVVGGKILEALAAADQLKEGDMSRLALAVARLTQANISQQRRADEVKERQQEHTRAAVQRASKPRGGLSPETSQRLRNALLGVKPFDEPETATPTTAAQPEDAGGPTSTAAEGNEDKH